VNHAYFHIRAGDLVVADSLLRLAERTVTGDERNDAIWWRVVTLRFAGRPRAAAVLAARYPPPRGNEVDGPGLSRTPVGASLFEAGELVAAGRVLDSAGMHSPAFWRRRPGLAARQRAWGLTQRATVAAAEGDTAALRRLTDSIAQYAQRSAFGRDQKLPTYVRGLALERAGRLTEAADSFRAAMFSPTEGYTRVNYEFARTLLALGRPREGIPWLQSALRGGLEASNYFLTRTEVHELLAQCFAAAGLADSARAHATWVARAWVNAEPEFASRRAVMERLATR
jgi:hypothetical protein